MAVFTILKATIYKVGYETTRGSYLSQTVLVSLARSFHKTQFCTLVWKMDDFNKSGTIKLTVRGINRTIFVNRLKSPI